MGRPSAGSVPINCSNNILLVRQSPCWYLSFPLELDNDVCHNVFSTYSKILSGFFLGLSRAKNTSDTIVDWKFFSFSSIRYMHVWDICVEIRATQKVGSGGNHNLDQSGMLICIPQCIILEFPDTLSQWLRVSGNSSEKLHCGNVVIMPNQNTHRWHRLSEFRVWLSSTYAKTIVAASKKFSTKNQITSPKELNCFLIIVGDGWSLSNYRVVSSLPEHK